MRSHLERAIARPSSWLVAVVIGLTLMALPSAILLASEPGEPILPQEQEVVDLVNAERAKRSIPPLIVNYSLQEAAWAHNEHMVKTGCFSHRGCGDGDPGSRIAKTGYKAATWGENIARVKGWVVAVPAVSVTVPSLYVWFAPLPLV